jgi:hypothetical protein
MEAATLSGMRAARATWTRVIGRELPAGAPGFRPDILPPEQWYGGNDPWERGAGSPEEVG